MFSQRICPNFSLHFVQISLQVILKMPIILLLQSIAHSFEIESDIFDLLGGIQFATAQLPNLEIMDCGFTICDPNPDSENPEANGDHDVQKMPNSRQHLVYQKLIIKHSRLKKLSLWGCSGLDVSIYNQQFEAGVLNFKCDFLLIISNFNAGNILELPRT